MRKSKNQILIEALREGEIEVTFTKKNGETRIMECTLNFDLIPSEHHPYTNAVEEADEKKTSLAVFATDIQAWRSFILANVVSWKSLTTD